MIQVGEFELLTAMTTKIIVLHVLMPCGLIDMCILWDFGLRFLDLRFATTRMYACIAYTGTDLLALCAGV
jgi:hypothetical protein